MTSTPPAKPRKNSKQVLIIDSNPAMGRLLGKMIKKAGLNFAIAANGADGLQFCQSAQYDVAIIEAGTGRTQGIKAMQTIRTLSAHYAAMPIIAVSTKHTAENVAHYKKAGATATLAKPIVELALMKLLKQHLGISIKAASRLPQEDEAIYAILDHDEMALLNWNAVKEYSSMLKGDYKRLMQDYLVVTPDYLGEIGEAIIDKNANQVAYLAHKLKSTSIIFGAEDVSNLAAQLEILGKEQDLTDANQFYKELHMSFERTKPVLKKKLTLMKMDI